MHDGDVINDDEPARPFPDLYIPYCASLPHYSHLLLIHTN